MVCSILITAAPVFVVVVAVVAFFLFFSEFCVLVILLIAVNYEIAHSVTHITYMPLT